MSTDPNDESRTRPRRRSYDPAFKRALVEQTLVPGVSVARIAREHGINANQLFTWRRRQLLAEQNIPADRQGGEPGASLVPVTVVAGEPSLGLSALVHTQLESDPFNGHLFVVRGRRGDLVKVLWWDGQGMCLFSKRLEKGRFIWPSAPSGAVALTPAQLSMLLEGIDWRLPLRTWQPHAAA